MEEKEHKIEHLTNLSITHTQVPRNASVIPQSPYLPKCSQRGTAGKSLVSEVYVVMYTFHAVIIPSDIDIAPLSFIMLEGTSQRFFRLTRLLDHKGFAGMYSTTCIQTYLRSVFFFVYVKSSRQCFIDGKIVFQWTDKLNTDRQQLFNARFSERLGPRGIRNGYGSIPFASKDNLISKITIFSSPYTC